MIDRRTLLSSSAAALGLSACGYTPPTRIPPGPLPNLSVDIHAHLFNGADLPVAGFLEQVVFREADNPVIARRRGSVTRLIAQVWTLTAKSARREYAELLAFAVLPERDPTEQRLFDEHCLAIGIAAFAEEVARPTIARSDVDRSEDIQLLRDLSLLVRPSTIRNAISGTFGPEPLTDVVDAEGIAAAIYGRIRPGDVTFGAAQPDLPPDLNDSLLQVLEWAGLLTRDRTGLLAEIKRLYGKPEHVNGISVFSPSLVDFNLWFVADEIRNQGDNMEEQIDLMSQLALKEPDVLLMNFAPFCPLRAALAAERGQDWLAVMQDAVNNKGFAGVKLYPPMGYLPWGNDPARLYGAKEGRRVRGSAINTQLRRLYDWCASEMVPIKSHANNSVDAQLCSGLLAAPENWGEVMERYPNMRVNLAHFGGFEEDFAPTNSCPRPPETFEKQAATLIGRTRAGQPRYPNLYVDIGYWTEVTGDNKPVRDPFITKLNELLGVAPNLGDQMLYGSDWLMIAQDRNANAYLADVRDALSVSAVAPQMDRIMGSNALRYLGLMNPDDPQIRRMSRFFPAGHPFHRLLRTS